MGLGQYFSFRKILSTAIIAFVAVNVLDVVSTLANSFSWPDVVETTWVVAGDGGIFIPGNAVWQKLIYFVWMGAWSWAIYRACKNKTLASIPFWLGFKNTVPVVIGNLLLFVKYHNFAGPFPNDVFMVGTP